LDPRGKTNIEKSIHKGIEYLIKRQNRDGSISLNNDTRWKVWETANAILSIKSAEKDMGSFFDRAISFLSDVQMEDGSSSCKKIFEGWR